MSNKFNIDVKEFEPIKIDSSKFTPSYSKVKSSFKQDLTIRDKSFKLDDVVAAQMTVEEEERRAFDERVNAEVEAKLNELKDNAYNTAFNKGMDDGIKKGYDEKVKELNEVIQDFKLIVSDLLSLREKMSLENEDFIIKLVYLIAETIIGKEIAQDPSLVTKTIKKVLEYSGAEEDIRIKISPRDYKVVEQIKTEIKDTFGKIKNLSIEPYDTVANGGCIVETNYGEINADLSVRFKSISKTLGVGL